MKATDYSAWWNKIDSLIKTKGLYKSALTEVNKLYTRAKTENQEAQQIKALVYRLDLQEQVEEFSDTLAVNNLQQELKENKGVTKAIFNVIIADYYHQYYQQHRWQLYNQTATRNYKKENLRTWGPADFHRTIQEHYLAAFEDSKLLQANSLEKLEPILIKGNARHLRPTLFDLLSWKAIEYFQEEPSELPRPTDAWTLKEIELFDSAPTFSQLKFHATDSSSHHFQAIRLYQNLLAFHLREKNPAALIDADLHRLQFLRDYGTMADKSKIYRKALEHLISNFKELPETDQVKFLLANEYSSMADYAKAISICEEVVIANNNTQGNINCYNLLLTLKQPELVFNTEKVNLPDQPFRALVNWKNINKIYLRTIKISPSLRKSLFESERYFDSTSWQQLLTETPIRTWDQVLPSTSDYKSHSVEVKVDGLPKGEYIIVASDNPGFNLGTAYLAACFFHVSNISYINNNNEYFVLHRNDGKPLSKAVVQTWYWQYDYQSRKRGKVKGSRYITNDQGYLKLDNEYQNRSVSLEITHNNDYLFLMDEVYQFRIYPDKTKKEEPGEFEAKNSHLYFFTDRSIYRPGQTVYFKGIAVTRDATSKKAKVYSGQETTVILFNANGEKVDSIKVTTNKYGSYSGQFKLPETGLTGGFRLNDKKLMGQAYFRVEEYKRPKFFAEFEPIKGSCRVNDSITVTGFAKAYAGNSINNANITYRITRKASFPYPWRFGWWPLPHGSEQEISNGKMETNADGSFTIRFKAIPDESIEKDKDPVFHYAITVDVTDLNGETRSASTFVPVSYKALVVNITGIQENLPIDSFKKLQVETKNIAGQFEASKVNLSIKPLESPGRLIRTRLWEQPDQFLMTENEFINAFPYDEYRNESNPHNWKRGTTVWEKVATTREKESISIEKKDFAAGWYEIEATAIDRFGDTVKDKAIVLLIDKKAKTLPYPSYMVGSQDKQVTEPGESVQLSIGSSGDNLFIVQQKESAANANEKDSEKPISSRYKFVTLNNEVQWEKLTISEEDRGGIGVTTFFVKHNRFYNLQQNISVPWSNKEFDIQVQSYRDKTLPGSQEKWTITINGKKGEKTATELLTGMYDASLEQFAPHQWAIPSIWPVFTRRSAWQGGNSFAIIHSTNNGPNLSFRAQKRVIYDRLISIGQTHHYEYNIMGAVRGVAVQNEKIDELSRIEKNVSAAPNLKADSEMREDQLATTEVETPTISGAITRKDFRETAFFFPQLQADASGNYSFSFTMPEALTTWKWQLLAHSEGLAFGYLQKNIITQKELMVQPNIPRFLREGDRMEFTTKIVNLSDKEMTGQVELLLFDASTNKPVDGWFKNMIPNQYFTVAAGSSELVRFPIEVPYQFDKALNWKIVARSENNTDGEEAFLPILSNRQLVTEAMPFFINGSGTKQYDFSKLISSGSSETLSNKGITIEFTSNPAWYAVQSLNYLSDYPYECSEQVFNRLYSNILAAHIIAKMPHIKSVIEKWQSTDTTALLSNLQKNQELKQVLLEETPWVLQANSESEQKKRIALLFDLVKLAANKKKLVAQLAEMQTPNGGFSWFKGGPDDRFITQYILTGIGHLRQLGAMPNDLPQLNTIVERGLPYIDARMKEDYDKRIKKTPVSYLNYYAVQYFYLRSFFPEKGIPGQFLPADTYFRKEIQLNWIKGNRMAKAMIALAMHRSGDKQTAKDILKSLDESAIRNEELGMYWKDNASSYYWQDAPIETQSLLIEVFNEIGNDSKSVGALKAWLLRNKQTNHWQTTKATADAIYALLLTGVNWLDAEPIVSVKLGNVTTVTASKAEAGTGYYKKYIPGNAVFAEMGKINVEVKQEQKKVSDLPVWGAVYWQYFENLDKITSAATPLRIHKQVMVVKLSKNGIILEPVTEGTALNVGDKIKIRIELTADRPMEYVHLKDMRASALEPTSVLSEFHWNGGLGYYQSTKDASTNFFISYLPKGSWVMEYDLFVSHPGVFSNGISTVQCMYAPEFTSHSEGIKIRVE